MLKYKNYSESKKGFTLIEVIISISILAIISIAFLSIFGNSITGIWESGRKNISHYEAQNMIESNISNPSNLPGNVTTEPVSITLKFPENNQIISGRKIDVTYNYGRTTRKLTTFTTR